MSFKSKVDFPVDFPKELINEAKSLEHIGISEVAWNWEDAIKVIEFLRSKYYAVIGGDVYKLNEGALELTYDSWYFNKNEAKSAQEFILESSKRAISYIKKYYERNGEQYYYAIVFAISK